MPAEPALKGDWRLMASKWTRAAIAGGNTTGVTRTYYANVNPGDVIDLRLVRRVRQAIAVTARMDQPAD